MAYVDPKYQVGKVISVTNEQGLALSTATASATATYSGTAGKIITNAFRLPNIPQAYQLLDVRVVTITAATASTSATWAILNGTNQAASGTFAAAGSLATATLTGPVVNTHGVVTLASSPTYMSTGGEMTWVTTYTATASGNSLGSYAVDFVYEDLFVT